MRAIKGSEYGLTRAEKNLLKPETLGGFTSVLRLAKKTVERWEEKTKRKIGVCSLPHRSSGPSETEKTVQKGVMLLAGQPSRKASDCLG
jgi:hypothetical protein